MSTIENNKIIAEFMGKEWHKEFFKDVFIISTSNITYKFDTDWNWLMEVVEKIERYSGGGVEIRENVCYIETTPNDYYSELETTKIQAVYKACVEFIKWYNQNK